MSALDRPIEIALARPCRSGAPLLHRLVDGELGAREERVAKKHVKNCDPCRTHLRLLELEEQALRELASPTPRRFAALWSDRLLERIGERIGQSE